MVTFLHLSDGDPTEKASQNDSAPKRPPSIAHNDQSAPYIFLCVHTTQVSSRVQPSERTKLIAPQLWVLLS